MEQVAAKLALVLAEHSAARRENANAVKDLEEQIRKHGEDQVVEQVAYTWFNRFCALRFMDANRYARMGVASPAPGQLQPEILAEAKMGHIDEEIVPKKNRQKIRDLLDGKAPSRDPQGEAYRLLLTAACNYWQKAMPFLFERIADYTELLMPDDLLSANSILTHTREAMTEDICKDVEAIGWLYQFYISEKKDEVFAGLKKNQKITPENIPAATQLFTPHWIVRYLVENSLGRLWMLNRPHSKLAERMDYYIRPEQEETDFLRVDTPEEITVCDPACGSGHMLTYAFDLLYAIYEEEGYDPAEIPEKILTRNLYGMEIDKRAGQLAAFALTMKARGRQRRFFERGVRLNICVLENIQFEGDKLNEYMESAGPELFTLPLQRALHQFKEANNFGSLIRPEFTDAMEALRIRRTLKENKKVAEDLLLQPTHDKIRQALKQMAYLGRKYHVVITNPPYMGSKNMNGGLAKGLKKDYPDVKSDLFSAFIVRNTEYALPRGQLGFMSPFVWMFISSYEKLRVFLVNNKTITSLVQLEYSGFDGATVPICIFTVENVHHPDFKGGYVRLSDFRGSENQAPQTLKAIQNPDCGWFYRASAVDFNKIPGSPISYWVKGKHLFEEKTLGHSFISGGRNKTHNNEKYMRFFWEISHHSERWVSYANGGDFRKYAGNELQFVDWSPEAILFYDTQGGLINSKFWNKEGITWSKITSAINSFRIKPKYSQWSSGSPTIFTKNFICDKKVLSFLNSPISYYYLKAINPTLNTTVNDVLALPFLEKIVSPVIIKNTDICINMSKFDWDSYETSWDFSTLPLLNPNVVAPPPPRLRTAARNHL